MLPARQDFNIQLQVTRFYTNIVDFITQYVKKSNELWCFHEINDNNDHSNNDYYCIYSYLH